jgi:hypothetical protein
MYVSIPSSKSTGHSPRLARSLDDARRAVRVTPVSSSATNAPEFFAVVVFELRTK